MNDTPPGTRLEPRSARGLVTSQRIVDNALLMGSILLFTLIAAIMIATRKVDWYRLGRGAALGESASRS